MKLEELEIGTVKGRVVIRSPSIRKLCNKYGISVGVGHVADIILMAEEILPFDEIQKLIGKYLKNPFLRPKEVYDEIYKK